jgi:tetratricopeptide (TPR) repeat protein/predicted Ser/Thr protein kinase
LIGARVSHYRIISKLGYGGMGEVYAADDEHLRRRVAIKFPNLEDETGELRRRFQHEARVASKLTHPNIARIYDYGESPDGRPFLVMELVNGTSLREVLRQGRLTGSRPSAVIGGVLRALAEAHRNGLVHRDIKPANVMLAESNEVKVLDFGLAKDVSALPEAAPGPEEETVTAGITGPGIVPGTPAYMSPEQARGESVDARSDLFSAGLLLYQCLTGVPAFSGSSARAVLDQLLATDPVAPSARVPALSKDWDRVIARALQKDPDRRYQSAEEMLAALETAEQSQTRSLARTAAATLVGSKPRAAATGLTAAAVVLIAILLLRGGGPHDPPAEAAEWYQRGAMALRDGTYYAAARMLQKAVDLDHDFALAHARLAEAAGELDDGARAASEMLAALPKGSAAMPGGSAGMYIDAIHRTLTGDFTGAVKVYQQLAANGPDSEKAAALVDLGRVYEKSGQGVKALEAFQEALTHDAQNAAAHLRAGMSLGRLRKPQSSAELDRAFALYQALSNIEGQAEVLYQRGYLLSSVDPAAAKVALEKARDMARTIPSEQQDVAATLQLSTVAYLSGEMEAAEKLAAEGVERAQRAGMNYLAARGLADKGNTQFLKGDNQRAAANFQESLDLARRFQMRRAEARALFGLANAHQAGGPVEAALTEAPAALAYYREAGYQIEASLCLMVLARAHRDLGHGDEAIANLEQVLTEARQASDPIRVAQAQQILASVLLTYGRWPQAIDRYEEFRQSATALNDFANVVRSLNGKAAALWRLGRYGDAEKAVGEADRALEKAPAQMRSSLETSILNRKAEMSLSRGRNAEAATLARRVFESKAASVQTAQGAICIAGLAIARSGQAVAGRRLCEPAVAALLPRGDQFAVTEARMSLAEIAFAQGDMAAAEQAIALVIEWTDRVKDRETGWRAWSLRARARQRGGDREGAKAAGERAADSRAGLGWDEANYRAYLGRPDIRVMLTQFQGGTKQ